MTGRPKVQDAQQSMAGGLNTVSSPSALLPTQLRLTTNARLTQFGAVQKRGGTQRLTASVLHANGVQNGFCWRQDTGAAEILAVANGTLYTLPVTTIPMTATAEAGALSSSAVPSFAQFRAGTAADIVYIADGGPLNKWDGSALTVNLASTPNVTNLCVHNQRLWGTGDASAPQSIYYSALNNGDTLGVGASDGGVIIVRTFGDEVVQGVASINTSLLIFHRRGISRITGYGEDDIVAAPAGVTADVGTIAPESIVAFDNIAYFLTDRGLYRANEAAVQPVGTPDMPDPLFPRLRAMTATQFDGVRCELNRATRELWVYLPGSGVYVYHTVLNAWAGPFTGTYTSGTVSALFWGLDSNGLPVQYMGKADGWLLLCDPPAGNTDNITSGGVAGTAVTMDVRLRRFFAKTPSLSKAWRWLYLSGTFQTTTEVSWSADGVNPAHGGPVALEATGTDVPQRVPLSGIGYFLDVYLQDAGTGVPVLYDAMAEGFATGWRGTITNP